MCNEDIENILGYWYKNLGIDENWNAPTQKQLEGPRATHNELIRFFSTSGMYNGNSHYGQG